MAGKPERDTAATKAGDDHSPLMPQVKKILTNQGYRPVVGSQLYRKVSALGDFVEVTKNGVQPYGVVPRPEKETHLAFVARNTRYLFK